MNDFLQAQSPIIMAHRGGGGEAPENLLAAFRNAAAQGFRYFETDVHLAENGKLYMYHGPFSLLAPKLLPAGNTYDELESLFREFPDYYISVDPKHEAAAEPLAKLIAQYDRAPRTAITCPSDDSRTARVADLTADLSGERPVTILSTARASARSLLSVHYLAADRARVDAMVFYVHRLIIRPKLIRKLHDQELKVIVYTVNDLVEMQRLLDWGVDGFMTDYPKRAKEFLPDA